MTIVLHEDRTRRRLRRGQKSSRVEKVKEIGSKSTGDERIAPGASHVQAARMSGKMSIRATETEAEASEAA